MFPTHHLRRYLCCWFLVPKVELAEVPLVAAVVEEATRGCAKGRQEGTERTEGRAGQTVAMEPVGPPADSVGANAELEGAEAMALGWEATRAAVD